MEQVIDYCRAPDGVTIAYAVVGSGPPLIRTGMWFTHLEEELGNDSYRSLWEDLAEHFTLVRYDMRGTGLSDRNIDNYSEQQLVQDHCAVLDALGFDSAHILGMSQGAVVAWLVAESNPKRVDKIITLGGYDVGVLHRKGQNSGREAVETFASIIRTGWAQDDPSFRNVFSTQFHPSATKEQLEWFSNFQKVSSTPEIAERNYRFFANMDMSDRVAKIEHSHLLLHATRDQRVDISIARDLCAKLPNARLVAIDSDDHVPNKRPEDRKKFYRALSDFLDVSIVEKSLSKSSILSRLDHSVDKIEANRWFKLAVILGVLITLVSAFTLFL